MKSVTNLRSLEKFLCDENETVKDCKNFLFGIVSLFILLCYIYSGIWFYITADKESPYTAMTRRKATRLAAARLDLENKNVK